MVNNKVNDLRRNYGVEGGPDADIAFYFDTLHLALKGLFYHNGEQNFKKFSILKCEKFSHLKYETKLNDLALERQKKLFCDGLLRTSKNLPKGTIQILRNQ